MLEAFQSSCSRPYNNRALLAEVYLVRGKRSEPAVESFFTDSYRTFKQRDITETIDFVDMGY